MSGDLYLISKENQDLYSTGTGFAFIPHHKTSSSASSAVTGNSNNTREHHTHVDPSPQSVKLALERDDEDAAGDSNNSNTDLDGENNQKLQLSETIQDENGRFYHTTITPSEENPAFGKYICFINHPAAAAT